MATDNCNIVKSLVNNLKKKWSIMYSYKLLPLFFYTYAEIYNFYGKK